MNDFSHITSVLPYKRPFLFVDELQSVDDSGSKGFYDIREDEYFFEGHFPGNPVVPGVILTEIMAQIGLVCLGVHLNKSNQRVIPAFTSSNIEFLAKAGPGERLIVESEKVYFRFNKLKCNVVCKKTDGTVVAKGDCSGMIIPEPN